MSTTRAIEGEPVHTDLADEVHNLEEQEAALERRTRSLELGGPLTLVFSLLALALSIGALVVALSHDSNGTGRSVMPSAVGRTGMTSGNAAGAMMAGGGGQGRFSAATIAAAAKG